MVKKKIKITDQEEESKNTHQQQDMKEKSQKETSESTNNEEIKNGDDSATVKNKKESKKSSRKKSKQSKEEEYALKVQELNDKYLRLYSEFDNYRRRTSKEKIDMAKTASEGLIIELLPVLDDFERAIKSSEEVENCDAVKEGINLIFNKFQGVLSKKGLTAIESTGEVFDTDFHEAITFMPSPTEDMKGKVIDTTEKGYLLNEKVIRYSKVVIGQ